MARRVGFNVYQITIRNSRARDCWQFDYESAEDGFSLILNYLKERQGSLIRLGTPDPDTGEYVDHRAIKLIRLDSDQHRRTIEGVFLKGEAGLVRQVFNLNTPDAEKPSYTIAKDETDLTPLYFRLHLEDGHRFGIAILQTFGRDGLKGFLQDDLANFFRGTFTVKLTQYLDGQVLEALAAAGRLQDVILINNGGSQTSRDRMKKSKVSGQALGGNGDKLELRLHRADGWAKATLKRLVGSRKKRAVLEGIVATPLDNAFDDLCVEVKQDGRIQKFSLLNPDDSPVRYDKDREVMRGSDGYPTYDSLKVAADDVWGSVEGMLGWRV